MVDIVIMLQSAEEKNPLLFTIATLTGHVIRAFGPDYTVGIERMHLLCEQNLNFFIAGKTRTIMAK